jgi:hypothetical protein
LRGILDQSQPVTAGNVSQRFQIRRLTIQMDGQDYFRAFRNRTLNFVWIYVVSARVDVYKDGTRPNSRNRFGSCDKSMGGGYHFVAWLKTDRQQSEQQRPGSGGDTYRIFGSGGRRQRLFKLRNFITQNKAGAVNDALNGRIDLRLDAGILSF